MDPADWLSGNPWSYLVMALSIAGSAVFPPLPSELTLVTAMSLAVAGDLHVIWVAGACGAGSLTGDLMAYTVGRAVRRHEDGVSGSNRVKKAMAWVEGRDRVFVGGLIAVGRFIPGGTTAVGLASGAIKFPLPAFVALAATGAAVWTAYGYGLATVGSKLFPGSPWTSALAAVVLVFAIAGLVKLFRGRIVSS